MIDPLGKIKRLANKDNAETYDPATDSLEALQELITPLATMPKGVAVIRGEVDSAAPSVTDHLVSVLSGFGDDFFNDHFYMQVVHAGGVAPEGEVRLITDYISATGFFETGAFTDAVEAGDLVAIIHQSLVAAVGGTKLIINDTALGSLMTIWDNTRLTEPADYWYGALVLCTAGTNVGQVRRIVGSLPNTVSVIPGFADAIVIGDEFLIISDWRQPVFEQQDAVPINTTVSVVQANIVQLGDSGHSYMLNSVRLKFANPGANTITVRLYEWVNNVETQVDSFSITSANWGTYHSLMDMFGEHHLAGDYIRITAQVSGGGPYALIGQYQYAAAYPRS